MHVCGRRLCPQRRDRLHRPPEDTMIKISDKVLSSMTDSEKSVISYITRNPGKAAEMSITNLAEASYTSPATVSRAIRKCGFSGIPDLRKHIFSKAMRSEEPYQINEVLEKSLQECTETIENVQISDIHDAAAIIRSARKIFVLARGVTTLTSEEFRFQLQLHKYTALPVTDSNLMRRIDHLVDPEDILVIFTAYNSSPEFEIAAKKARQLGCRIITLCCKKDAALMACSDVYFLGHTSPIVDGNSFNAASRLPLQIISRAIVEYLAK